jgi:hypothetical protein
MRRILPLLLLASAALAFLQVTAAYATAPVQFRFTNTITFTDTTTCGFPIALNLQVIAVGRAFVDAQGNPQSMTTEQSVVGTDSANGITLRENDHFVDFTNSVGSDKEVGLPIHIQGGGVVIRDAGYILFNPDGSVAFIHGPHPFLEGDTAAYCAALS